MPMVHRAGQQRSGASIVGVLSVEFLILGRVAGLRGAILASVGLTAAIAVAAGWAASFRILGRKPLEILREE